MRILENFFDNVLVLEPSEKVDNRGTRIVGFNKDEISEYLSVFDVKSRIGVFEYDKIANPIISPDGNLLGCTYTLENIRFIDTPSGFISIVDMPYCKNNGSQILKKPYVIGADTAGTGKDFFTAKVIDNTNAKCVATLRKQ